VPDTLKTFLVLLIAALIIVLLTACSTVIAFGGRGGEHAHVQGKSASTSATTAKACP
jgi:flagellar basal body-associated protein FliL